MIDYTNKIFPPASFSCAISRAHPAAAALAADSVGPVRAVHAVIVTANGNVTVMITITITIIMASSIPSSYLASTPKRSRTAETETGTGIVEWAVVLVVLLAAAMWIDARDRAASRIAAAPSNTRSKYAQLYQKSHYKPIKFLQNPRYQWTSLCGQILSTAHVLCVLQFISVGLRQAGLPVHQ